MNSAPRPTVLCLASFFKGNRFFQRLHEEGCYVILITSEKFKDEDWARQYIHEFHSVASFEDRTALLNGVSWLFRNRRIDRIVALDDFDVEVAAAMREHFRMPGMGDTAARFFRDKLAMRVKAKEVGINVPRFTPVFHHPDVTKFLAEVPAPWLIKPRGEASAVGIKKLRSADEAWAAIHELGDKQSHHVLEQMIPGELYHVDSLVQDGKIAFAEVGSYGRPLLEVAHEGGIYVTRTLRRDSKEARLLLEANAAVLQGFGLRRGASHTEFIIGREDGKPYFIETSARVGGANISEMVEAATGVNLWSEWAKLEIEGEGFAYKPPRVREEYAGVVISLARDEYPDTRSFSDPEIIERLKKKNHIGFVVRSPKQERVEELLKAYLERISREFHASLPAPPKSTS
ncbi:ATP-grasp domain-containing protein [Hyalangium rubrum]|uniref:ATP-grasp domain-containing protein n=1 Tax=Hyalangium rubrum TaxID=3103134 RepID=A0ABU5GZU8_9BACT|nr:ATP-grasp domain-containing protein [Hyalangium sp. s54d21]MDY7226402.1 ATP-grasp domain-containing protein [Hyalangium sp. s54d21]